MSLPEIKDIAKEEFSQSYVQYRWLDETRTKYIDRFFLIIIAAFIARFRLAMDEENALWRAALYLVLLIVLPLMARSIITFRRQQRGHVLYIKAVRERLRVALEESCETDREYLEYLDGKPVFLSRWIELAVLLVASLVPLVFLDLLPDLGVSYCWGLAALAPWAVLVAWFLWLPFVRYNRKKAPDWKRH